MTRRIGIILATTCVTFLLMSDGALACRCMNRLINRCGHRRVSCQAVSRSYCCRPYCCQPVASPSCCQPAGREVKPVEAAKPVQVESNPIIPAVPKPEAPVPSKPQAAAPMPETPPALPPATPPEKKPEPTPPPKTLPSETPAERRVPAKPDGVKPDMPKPDDVKPDAPKPDAPKPDTPKPKDSPFDAAAGGHDDTLRTWTDASGKYQIEARFVSLQDSTVRLQKADGRYVRIAYDLLGLADQAFVLNHDRGLFATE
jgi:hypothetical protein